jgi:predicted lipase
LKGGVAQARTSQFQVSLIVKGKSTKAIVGKSCDFPSVTVISFRGSANSENWSRNLEVTQVAYPFMSRNEKKSHGIKVHHGFLKLYSELRPTLLNIFQGLDEIVFTGHSLGGALASLAALDAMALDGKKHVKLITYGTPRLGNKLFSEYLHKAVPWIRRVVESNDVVPLLPPLQGLFSGPYVPEGPELHVQENGLMYFCDVGDLARCSSHHTSEEGNFSDHNRYRKKLFFGAGACGHPGTTPMEP